MNKQVEKIIALFHEENVLQYRIEEIRLENEDSRWVIFVDFPTKKYVIKIAANNFTSKERVNGWVEIIDAYRHMGYYSPAIMKSRQGHYVESLQFHAKQCIVWEEEYAKYYLRSTLDKSLYLDKDGNCSYRDDILAFIGKIAEKHYHFFPYKSGWVRFEPFGDGEKEDEISDCVKKFDTLVRENATHHIGRWEEIYSLYEVNKKGLLETYKDLPTSVFQSDHFGDNLLFDKKGHFKGVIDYNLAGMDTVINVFLYTVIYGHFYSFPQISNPKYLSEYNPISQDFVLKNISNCLEYLRRFYTFSKEEEKAILPLYKYITCIEYRQIDLFKKYMDNDQKLLQLFDAMEYELKRNSFPGPFLVL